MALYTYKIKDKKGKLIEDVMQSSNKNEVVAALKAQGFQVLTVKSVDTGLSKISFGSISTAEKANFCRFMGTILRSGLSLSDAVDIIKGETKNQKLKKILLDISFSVRKGSTLSGVMSRYKDDFGPVFLTMIKAGEQSGTLDKSFDYLSKQLLNSHELSQKVKGALMYPAVITVAMIGNAVVMIVFVLPKISDVFLKLNVALPIYTEITLKFGEFVGNNVALVLGSMVLMGVFGFLLMYIHITRTFILNQFVKLPIVRKVVGDLDIARFARTLSTLLKSGVPILVSLEVATDVLAQPKLHKQAIKFKAGVEQGKSLSEVLEEGDKDVFPATMVQTIRAGEKTGALDQVLEEMADFYEKEVDFGLKRLTGLLEPLLMLVIGLAVGAMVLMMITPIYSIVGGLEQSL